MPKPLGLFDDLADPDLISVEKIKKWLRSNINSQILENALGNRILYPYSIPVAVADLEFDLAVLREAVKFQPEKYFDSNLQKMIIPADYLNYVANLPRLAWVFIDAFEPEGVVALVLKSEAEEKVVGTVIRPEMDDESGDIRFSVGSQKYEIGIGSVMSLPATEEKVEVSFESTAAKLLGKEELTLTVAGGQLGVIIDTRIKKE